MPRDLDINNVFNLVTKPTSFPPNLSKYSISSSPQRYAIQLSNSGFQLVIILWESRVFSINIFTSSLKNRPNFSHICIYLSIQSYNISISFTVLPNPPSSTQFVCIIQYGNSLRFYILMIASFAYDIDLLLMELITRHETFSPCGSLSLL